MDENAALDVPKCFVIDVNSGVPRIFEKGWAYTTTIKYA